MTVNKHAKVRAGLCWTKEIAVLTRLHNDANIVITSTIYINHKQ
jgi:ribose 5-phosphate isomerase B